MSADDLRVDLDLGADSLELMTLATAPAESVHLHESGIEDYLPALRTLGAWVDITATGLARYSERLTFRTSGSSGTPKPCCCPPAWGWAPGTWSTCAAARRPGWCAARSRATWSSAFQIPGTRWAGPSPSCPGRGGRDRVRALSGRRCAQQVQDAGIERLVHVYGASGTGGSARATATASLTRCSRIGRWRAITAWCAGMPGGGQHARGCKPSWCPSPDGIATGTCTIRRPG